MEAIMAPWVPPMQQAGSSWGQPQGGEQGLPNSQPS